MKSLITLLTILVVYNSSAQFYTGYYMSDPQVHSFDHFRIRQAKSEEGKLQGDLQIHAYEEKIELWTQTAHYVTDKTHYNDFVAKYNYGKEIISVHQLKFMWDGNEWEYVLLGYVATDKHRHFIVIEEIFNDESETELLEFHKMDWIKAHHLIASSH